MREEHWAVAGSARTLQWETVFVYDPLGALVAEYDTRSPGTAGIRYLTVDQMGSTRMVTKESGTTEAQVVDTRHDYLPFGEEVRSTGGPKEKFTGKERADVAGARVDYFGARYMSAMLGRFTSPDLPLLAQHQIDPQSWNLYSYTANNPLARIDPDGRNWFNINGGWEWHRGADVDDEGNPCKKGTHGCHHSDATHLIVFEVTHQNRRTKAAHGTLTLYGNDEGKPILISEAFSGGPGKKPAGESNYTINLRYSILEPSDVITQGSGAHRYGVLRPNYGVQELPVSIMGVYSSWGRIRARLNEPTPGGVGLPEEMKFLFLHGSFDFLDYTNGCLCERRERILRWLRDAARDKPPGVFQAIPVRLRGR